MRPMQQTESTGAHYGTGLARVMAEQGVSIRGLAKRLDPGNPENVRRAIRRYLQGDQKPTVRTREQIADALGVDRTEIEGDPELASDLFMQARAAKEAQDRAGRRLERLLAALLECDAETAGIS